MGRIDRIFKVWRCIYECGVAFPYFESGKHTGEVISSLYSKLKHNIVGAT
ncbi:hypothetical protein F9C07_9971 [Aspergillus flavus]|uniref:Uncharacterized protein n=1 Tax=Aspergillus flavus (strain ATCC 200026 / FGSC A1120 / IAM 13836 / NRRL 3357 / JCM 12722 / SRRC 167) TaxID=332952 RepID=A0A7U2QR65_ASPFN|nr:hypothetical protein F9C07_9971 [Aspergillus flavus]